MSQVIVNLLMGLMLSISSWLDIKKKIVSGRILGIFAIVGALLCVVLRPISILSVIGGISIGLVIIGISKITKGSIGMGDGELLCVTGLYLGFYKNLELFFGALFMAAIWGIVLLVIKRAGKKTEMPFVPFVAMAYILMNFL